MTCGKWGQPGHEGHTCVDCTSLFLPVGRCKRCEVDKDCGFIRASPETLKSRDEAFSSRKNKGR